MVEILKQLNEITSSINENPDFFKKIIADHFGSQIASLFNNELNFYIDSQKENENESSEYNDSMEYHGDSSEDEDKY